MGNRVHSGLVSWRQGGLHSTIVSCRGPVSHSTRTWSRACGGTRCSHQRRARAMSSSGGPGIWSVFQAVADVGGVGGPVPGAGSLPGDGDGDVDAEQAGQDRGGQDGGELEQGGGAGPARVDAELAQAFGHAGGADGAAGLAAGEQPGRGVLAADGCVTPAGRGELQDQGAERLGEQDRLAAEPDAHLAVFGLDVAWGEAADRGRPLSVEEDEQASDAVFGFERVVAEQPACLFPPGFGVDDARRAVPFDGRDVQLRQLVLAGPADEVPRVDAMARLCAGQPCLQVALAGGGQGEGVGGEPVQDGGGGPDAAPGGAGLLRLPVRCRA